MEYSRTTGEELDLPCLAVTNRPLVALRYDPPFLLVSVTVVVGDFDAFPSTKRPEEVRATYRPPLPLSISSFFAILVKYAFGEFRTMGDPRLS